MKPVILLNYRDFLIRVVVNGPPPNSHPFEWTIDGRTKKSKDIIKKCLLNENRNARLWGMTNRTLSPKYDEFMQWHSRPRCFNNRMKRLYDPTSMPTDRGSCSALDYGKDAVDNILGNQYYPFKAKWCHLNKKLNQ